MCIRDRGKSYLRCTWRQEWQNWLRVWGGRSCRGPAFPTRRGEIGDAQNRNEVASSQCKQSAGVGAGSLTKSQPQHAAHATCSEYNRKPHPLSNGHTCTQTVLREATHFEILNETFHEAKEVLCSSYVPWHCLCTGMAVRWQSYDLHIRITWHQPCRISSGSTVTGRPHV